MAIIARVVRGFDEIGALLDRVRLKEALEQTMAIVREANVYLDRREPWKTIKTDPEDAARAVYTILRVIDNLKTLLAPFLPFSSQSVHEYLGYDGQIFGDLTIQTFHEETRSHEALVYDGTTASGRWQISQLQPGQALRQPSALFTKLDPEIVEQERSYLGQPQPETPIEV